MGLPKGQSNPPASLRRREPDPVFGMRKALPTKVLPLVREVGQALVFEAEEERLRKVMKENDSGHATKVASEQVLAFYKKASIPTLDTCREARVGGKGEIMS